MLVCDRAYQASYDNFLCSVLGPDGTLLAIVSTKGRAWEAVIDWLVRDLDHAVLISTHDDDQLDDVIDFAHAWARTQEHRCAIRVQRLPLLQ
ncbi:hypothetical protein [Chitinolyticbacter meiyuanensis]|uniref:hypothetical protein n=1 Tax=Chitinolyticbacter meiyuanensis TaxID=682798 RepID=UPI0011E5A472|nr:hypothetical protein [Chitinolyticbacter meiyuanensis]